MQRADKIGLWPHFEGPSLVLKGRGFSRAVRPQNHAALAAEGIGG